MGITLYGSPFSPPCRVVSLTLDVLGLDYDYKNIDLFAGENKTEDYLKVRIDQTNMYRATLYGVKYVVYRMMR